jgi:hypothetical protein
VVPRLFPEELSDSKGKIRTQNDKVTDYFHSFTEKHSVIFPLLISVAMWLKNVASQNLSIRPDRFSAELPHIFPFPHFFQSQNFVNVRKIPSEVPPINHHHQEQNKSHVCPLGTPIKHVDF